MMPLDNQSEAEQLSISRVAVRPPPFWKPNPILWFAQLEAQFDIANITVDATKFNHVISAIESDVLNSVTDIILHPPATDKYTTLKQRLIDIHSESQESKIRSLLQGLELGDQRPSQLLTRMRALAGETVGEPLLKSLWLSRLPLSTQSILAALSEQLPQLAVIADKIAELPSSHNVHAATPAQPSLEHQIAMLTKQVSELSAQMQKNEHNRDLRRNKSRSNSRSRSQSRVRFRQYKEPSNNLCFYHTNFGAKARKCSQPCSYATREN